MIEARRPDMVGVDKVKKETMITEILGDTRVCNKEREKIEKYSLLKEETARSWQNKKVIVISIVIGALVTTTRTFEK